MSSDAAADGGSVELIEHLLEVGRRRLGMELAWFSTFRGGDQLLELVSGDVELFGLDAGDSSPLTESYCLRVVDGRLPNLIPDTASNDITAGLTVTAGLGIGSYVGVPVTGDDGGVVGMLCCVSRNPAGHLSKRHVHTMELLAALIGELVGQASPADRRAQLIRERVLAEMSGEGLRIEYQPIVEVTTGTVVGVEALTRFSAPPADPEAWFGEARTVGLGTDLELAAVETALRGLEDLPSPVYLGINVSPEALSDPRLVTILRASDPRRVVLEITEHTPIHDYRQLRALIAEMRGLGVRIAVDDVGAGFSSFAHVLELCPELLKIDVSITRNLHRDPARQALAAAVVGVADRIGATVVAEGIEEIPELDAVADIGIAFGQGYLLARPGPLPPPTIPYHAPTRPRTDDTASDAYAPAGDDLASRRFELTQRHSPVGVAIVGLDGAFLSTNLALCAMLGYTESEFATLDFQTITHPDDLDADLALVQECIDGTRDDYRINKRYLHHDGYIIWGDLSVALLHDDTGTPRYFISQIQDITERTFHEHEFHAESTIDPFTGLHSRDAARSHIQTLLENDHAFSVLFCRVESLHDISRRLGPAAADDVLRTIARRLHHVTRHDTDHVARWDRDEFIVTTTTNTTGTLIARITELAAQPIPSHEPPLTTRLTIRTAHHHPDDHDTVDTVDTLTDIHTAAEAGAVQPGT